MMPERMAKTDPYQQIPEAIGSGPFKFVKSEWVPGNKAVFVKNTEYVPRKEPPSFASGGKVAKVDRVEWLYIPDARPRPRRSIPARRTGTSSPRPICCRCSPATPTLSSPPSIRSATRDLALQPAQPPFDNLKLRLAVLTLVDQQNYMRAAAGNDKYWKACAALFGCGAPFETNAGAEALLKAPDLAKAKELISPIGLQGRKDRAARCDRPADRARAGAGHRWRS